LPGIHEKSPMSRDTGLWWSSRWWPVSQAQRMPGQRICRTIGKIALASPFGFDTRPQGHHRLASLITGLRNRPRCGPPYTLYRH